MAYSWTFGDGTNSTQANPSHTYTTAGVYTVRLSVSDGATSTLAAPLTITVGTPPTATILTPTDGLTFRAGDVISYSGTASDAEDGPLPPMAYSWEVDLLHAGHVHPGLPVSGSMSGTFTIPTTGHDYSGNVRFRISLTVTDSSGISTTTSVVIWPEKVNLTFHTAPEGLTVFINGLAETTPFVQDELVGFNDTVEGRDQAFGGANYTFGSWSDGGAQSHTIVVPATDQSYTATFNASTPAPVAAYGFNEGSGTTLTDSSGHGLNGTVSGATWTTAGKYGGALSFNGSSNYVDLGNATPWALTGSATWSAWVYATGTPADDGQIISKSGGASGTVGWQLKTSPDTGPHTFAVSVSGDGSTPVQRYSTTVRQLNTWYYVAGVYDAVAQTLHIYVNGVLDDGVLRGVVPSAQFNPAVNTAIGRRTGGFYFQGRIDDVRVYSTALSQAQIQADMNTPVGSGPDTQAPTAPTGLAATAVSASRIDLSWTAATDNVGVAGYRVERCQGSLCTSFAEVGQPTALSYSDTGLAAGTTYNYRVRAVDAAGNLGPYSAIVTQTTPSPDTQAPTAPTGLAATAVSASRIDLSWTAATDNVGVAGYRVERCQGSLCTSFAEVGQPTALSYSDTGLAAGTTYNYRVRAVDAAGNLGPYSAIVTQTTPSPDTQAPTAPTGLAATAVSASRIDLSWTAATDNVGVAGYRVERCQGSLCTSFAEVGQPTALSYSDTGLAAGTTYNYRVRAVDAAGNLGPYSAIVTQTTPSPDTQAPTAPTGLAATAVSASRIDLSWTAATDNVGVAGYRVERCQGSLCTSFAEVGQPTALSYSDTGLAAGTTYNYRVRAVDAAGNLGPYSAIVTQTTHLAGHTGADGADGVGGDGGQREPDRSQLDGGDGQRRRCRLSGRALSGFPLHQLRGGGPADCAQLQRHRSRCRHHVQLPSSCGRRCRQSRPLLCDRHTDHPGPVSSSGGGVWVQ